MHPLIVSLLSFANAAINRLNTSANEVLSVYCRPTTFHASPASFDWLQVRIYRRSEERGVACIFDHRNYDWFDLFDVGLQLMKNYILRMVDMPVDEQHTLRAATLQLLFRRRQR